MNFNDLYKMVVEKLTIQPNTKDALEQKIISRIPPSEYSFDKIVSWYRRDKDRGVSPSELVRIYDTNLDDMISTFVDYYTELEKYKKRHGNDPRFLKNPFEQYRYSKGFFQNIDNIKREIRELEDVNRLLVDTAKMKKDRNGEFDIRPEDETRIKLIDSSTNVMVWSTEDFDTTNRFIFNFWGNANMNVGYYNPDINSPYCTRIRGNWESYSKDSITEQYQQIWFFLKPKGDYNYSTGDLTKPSVAKLFSDCKSQGPKLLLCMDDTGFDLLDRYDEDTNSGFGDNEYINPVIDEVKKLDKRFRDKVSVSLNKLAQDELVKNGYIPRRLKPHITRIEIPDGVRSIEQDAFYNCRRLTSVTIGNSVTSIGENAFSNCDGLTSVTIPDSVTSIGENAFQDCSSLTSVTIPNSVTSIGDYAFSGCVSLTSVTIPDSVTSIGDEAFSYCSGLTSVTIPDSVTSIGDYAFYNCGGLTKFIVDSNNPNYKSVNGLLLSKNGKTFIAGVNGDVVIPNGVTSIGKCAFLNCSGLTSVTIPNSVTSIGNSAFTWCSGLTSVTMPDSVTSIGKQAFCGCKNLTIQTTSRVAELLKKSGFEGDIEIISDEREENKPEDSLMREFVEFLKMDEY